MDNWSQNTEGKQAGDSLSGDHRGRGGQVRTWKVNDQARDTYFLETTEGGPSQDMERKQPSKGHSLSRDHRGQPSQDIEKK